MSKLPCYYAHGGLNYKNGFATVCPISAAKLQLVDHNVPSKFWNNDKFRSYRRSLDAGIWPEDCNLCKTAEEEGTYSMRSDKSADLSHYDPSTGTVKFTGLKHVELRFSNACNMACLHCSEVYSSNWGSRLKNYKPDKIDWEFELIQLTKTQHRESPDDKSQIRLKTAEAIEIVEDLNKNFPNIEKVDFAGGEVLYQKQFFPCLRKLAEHPNAKNMLVFFHTNFNADFDVVELNELLKMFGNSKIKISVDSGKNIYSYFRDGSWDKLKSNLSKLKKINNFSTLDAVCTTSIYQMLDIENVFLSLLDLDINGLDASIVYTPDYINPALIMRHFAREGIKDIQQTREKIIKLDKQRRSYGNNKQYRSWNQKKEVFDDIRTALESLDGVEKYIRNHKTEEKHWQAFFHYRRKIDVLWKQNFNDFFVKYKFLEDKLMRQEYKDVPYNKEHLLQPDNIFKEDIEFWQTKIANLENNPDDIKQDWLYQDEIDKWQQTINAMQENPDDSELLYQNYKIVDKDTKLAVENETNILKKIDLLVAHHTEQIRKCVKKREIEDTSVFMQSYNIVNDKLRAKIDKRDDDWYVKFRDLKNHHHEEIDKLLLKRREHNIKDLETKGLDTFIHDNVEIPFNKDWKNILVMLSGGADSACLTYILCKYIQDNNLDTKVNIVSAIRVWKSRPWAGPISEEVFNWLQNKFPNIINQRHTYFIPPHFEHGNLGDAFDGRAGETIILNEYIDYLCNDLSYDAMYNATTLNPPDYTESRMENRDAEHESAQKLTFAYDKWWKLMPLRQTAKDWIIKQYKDLGIKELFDTTRSCEGDAYLTTNMLGKDWRWYKENKDINECGQCFWCKEREWAKKQNEF